ncbi:maltose alpha-D-glucosyltransferase/ alpha-amylase [Pseudarcicella hirudinis]|uniref:Maltokinase n=1 Tax=Pseudarcicella hirudinis TaxID=1079859 RepID=A0A1I5PNB8_9BACT|nr:putative maltokinase [Pseudarcicella hirudinis]SFP35642.1 maltose alpha-D-glucosyltransferase/ alpha-amylase [Pseudarcicella hirudinis]
MNEIAINLNPKLPWESIHEDKDFVRSLEELILPPYINTCRWFAGKARKQTLFQITNILEIPLSDSVAFLLIVKVSYDYGEPESYLLPVSFIDAASSNAREILPKGIISIAIINKKRGLIVDAIYDERFQQALFKNLAHTEEIFLKNDKILFSRGKGLSGEDINAPISSRVLPVDSSNSAMVFGEKYFMKLYRKLFEETNPEVDMVSFLTENSDFAFIPAFAGSVVWKQKDAPDITLGMMQRMVENQQDSWTVTGTYVDAFVESFTDQTFAIKEDVFQQVELLAQRTAEMHLALYSPDSEEGFSPEPFDEEYRTFLYKRLTDLLDKRYNMLIDSYTSITDPVTQKLAWDFMESRELIEEFAREILHKDIESLRVRIHGDYHLGQVLATGNDYIIIDFEGEPESSISERKIKHSPLKDAAGMIRSYHYAISSKMFNSEETKELDIKRVQTAADRWYRLVLITFMEKYLDTFGKPHPLFKNNNEINFLMLIYLLEKAVYELGYEICYRPDWVKIPLKGIVNVIREIEKLKM